MFGVVSDYYSSKLKSKQYKQNTSPKIVKLKSKFSLTLGWINRALNNPTLIFIFNRLLKTSRHKFLRIRQQRGDRRNDWVTNIQWKGHESSLHALN